MEDTFPSRSITKGIPPSELQAVFETWTWCEQERARRYERMRDKPTMTPRGCIPLYEWWEFGSALAVRHRRNTKWNLGRQVKALRQGFGSASSLGFEFEAHANARIEEQCGGYPQTARFYLKIREAK